MDSISLRLLKIEMKDYIIELINNFYNLLNETECKVGEMYLSDQIENCISKIKETYQSNEKINKEKYKSFQDLIEFIGNLKENNEYISRKILPDYLFKQIEISNSKVSKKELVLL